MRLALTINTICEPNAGLFNKQCLVQYIYRMPSPTPSSQNLLQFNRFLLNNEQVLHQKYLQHFNQESVNFTNSSPDPHQVIQFMCDAFSIDSGEGAGTASLLQGLSRNYCRFMQAKLQQVRVFDFGVAIELLKFCVEGDQMMAVQYQSAIDEAAVTAEGLSQARSVANSKNSIKSQHQNKGAEQNHAQHQLYKRQPENKFDHAQQRRPPVPISHKQPNLASSPEQNPFLQNQFDCHEQIKIQFDPIILKKNLKTIFQFYCKQQMSINPNMSFQRIQRQSHTMTVGKLLLMARMMNVLSPTVTKELVLGKFRKISEGRKEIDFQKFDELVSQLQIEDPTLIARAQFNATNILPYLKTSKKAFGTQDLMPRELIKNRVFTNRITPHSGRLAEDLFQELENNKNSIEAHNKAMPDSKIKDYLKGFSLQSINRKTVTKGNRQPKPIKSPVQTSIITTKNLEKAQRSFSYDLSVMKMKKILPVEHEHDDDRWLNEYRISKPQRRTQLFDATDVEKRRSFDQKQAKNAAMVQKIRDRAKQMQLNQSNSQRTKEYQMHSQRRR